MDGRRSVSHDRSEETTEAKARRFLELSLDERMVMLSAVVDLALASNPDLAERRHAQSTTGRVQFVSAT